MRTLIAGGDVLTVDPARQIHVDGAVLVDGARIAAVGPRGEVEAVLGPPPDRVVEAHGGVIMPGLVDVHVHLVESLMRYAAEDVDLPSWVRTRLRPYEEKLDPATATVAAELALVELTCAGVTTVGESMLPGGDIGEAVARAAARSGLRVLLAVAVGGAHDGQGLTGFETLRDKWDGQDGRISVWLAPRALPQTTPRFLERVAESVRCEGTRMSWHFANSKAQYEWIAVELGRTPAQAATDLGLLRPGQLLGHCTWLGEGDVEVIAGSGAAVAHLPVTNLRLGMGIMPLVELRSAGVPVGIGTDGDNSHDLLDAARLAVNIQRWRSGPAAVSAAEALEMLTIEGARSLGLDGEIGSLEVGKRADLVILSTDGSHLSPRLDLTRLVTQSARASDVRTVLVNGVAVLEDGVPTRLDGAAICAQATARARTIQPFPVDEET